jgi:hypothetical protein
LQGCSVFLFAGATPPVEADRASPRFLNRCVGGSLWGFWEFLGFCGVAGNAAPFHAPGRRPRVCRAEGRHTAPPHALCSHAPFSTFAACMGRRGRAPVVSREPRVVALGGLGSFGSFGRIFSRFLGSFLGIFLGFSLRNTHRGKRASRRILEVSVKISMYIIPLFFYAWQLVNFTTIS